MAAKKRFGLADMADQNYTISSSAVVDTVVPEAERITKDLPLTLLLPNPFQPRKRPMNEQKLRELADSIEENGLIEAIIVRNAPGRSGIYEIVCGHRRYAACQLLQKTTIRSEILSVCTDTQMGMIAIVENDQREDVHPLDLAEAYDRLLHTKDENGEEYTTRSLGKKLGKDKDHISSIRNLLNLPDDLKDTLSANPSFPLRLLHELADLSLGDRTTLLREYQEQELKTMQMLAIARERKRQLREEPQKKEEIAVAVQPPDEEEEKEVVSFLARKNPPVKEEKEKREKPQPSIELSLLTLQAKIQAEDKAVGKEVERLRPILTSLEEEERKKVILQIETLVEERAERWKQSIQNLLF